MKQEHSKDTTGMVVWDKVSKQILLEIFNDWENLDYPYWYRLIQKGDQKSISMGAHLADENKEHIILELPLTDYLLVKEVVNHLHYQFNFELEANSNLINRIKDMKSNTLEEDIMEQSDKEQLQEIFEGFGLGSALAAGTEMYAFKDKKLNNLFRKTESNIKEIKRFYEENV